MLVTGGAAFLRVLAVLAPCSHVGVALRSSLDVQPILHVQRDLFETEHGMSILKLGEDPETNFTMMEMYGPPVCAGEGQFVKRERAPPDFCRYRNRRLDLAIEGRWHHEYDEYALEKVMLGKWLDSPLRCRDEHRPAGWCERHADLVVIPSPFLSYTIQLGWKWTNIWHISPDYFETYWKEVHTRYFRPSSGRTPLIVTHSSYCWSNSNWLRALSKQPNAFINHVVIAGIESNVPHEDRELFPPDWSASALMQLRHRALGRKKHELAKGPLLFTLPYPTSVLRAARFSRDQGGYKASGQRHISISFAGNLSKSASRNWIRRLVHRKMVESGSMHSRLFANSTFLCAPGPEEEENCGLGDRLGVWHVAADSLFCLEPPGDTPTRSHLYLAIAAGCIPVVLDGGHTSYEPGETGWWAWRAAALPMLESQQSLLPKSVEQLFVDFQRIAVVYNSDDVRAGKVDIMHNLTAMPLRDPQRIRAMQEAMDQVAPLMTFSAEKPSSWWPGHGTGPRDAFEAFQGIVVWEAVQLRLHGQKTTVGAR